MIVSVAKSDRNGGTFRWIVAMPAKLLAAASGYTLKKWFVARVDFESHSDFVLCGYVFGHQRLRDGQPAMTRPVLELSSDNKWARTLGSFHWLSPPLRELRLDSPWRLRLQLLANETSTTSNAELVGVEGAVEWPHPRSSSYYNGGMLVRLAPGAASPLTIAAGTLDAERKH
jgi:hypothetical protein